MKIAATIITAVLGHCLLAPICHGHIKMLHNCNSDINMCLCVSMNRMKFNSNNHLQSSQPSQTLSGLGHAWLQTSTQSIALEALESLILMQMRGKVTSNACPGHEQTSWQRLLWPLLRLQALPWSCSWQNASSLHWQWSFA